MTLFFFDSETHRSYISGPLMKKLGPEPGGEQGIHIVTFGCLNSKEVTTKFVETDVKTKRWKIHLTFGKRCSG